MPVRNLESLCQFNGINFINIFTFALVTIAVGSEFQELMISVEKMYFFIN